MNQRTWKRRAAALACAAAICGAAVACVFTWTGNGSDDDFANSANWAPQILPCPVSYPQNFGEFGDHAIFPDNLGTAWSVTLDASAHITGLVCKEGVDFDGGGGIALTTDTLSIAPLGGDIEITIASGAEIAVP